MDIGPLLVFLAALALVCGRVFRLPFEEAEVRRLNRAGRRAD